MYKSTCIIYTVTEIKLILKAVVEYFHLLVIWFFVLVFYFINGLRLGLGYPDHHKQ